MKKMLVFTILAFVLVLGACSKDEETPSTQGSANDGEAANGYGTIDHGVEDKKVGFNITGGAIEEAVGVPAEEKAQIMEAFTTYIEAFNEKDIDRYIDMLSEQTESFDKVGERAYMEEQFAANEFEMQASDLTIVKYDENEAQVFAKMKTKMKQLSSGLETNSNGRQVTVFSKEDGEWKVFSIHRIGDEE